MYCIGEEIPLSSVFEKLLNYETGGVTRISPKSNAVDLEAYFFEVLENYDEDRVYVSCSFDGFVNIFSDVVI